MVRKVLPLITRVDDEMAVKAKRSASEAPEGVREECSKECSR